MASYEFRLSDVGEGIHEVEVLEWKVRPGDRVRAFDPLVEVESAKAAVELTAPVAGRVAETRVPVGGTARVGEVLAVIETEVPADLPGPAPADAGGSDGGSDQGWFGIVGAAPRGAAPTTAPTSARRNAVRAAPLVRKIARDRGVRLEEVAGSGPEGRIRLADLEAHLAAMAASRPPPRAPIESASSVSADRRAATAAPPLAAAAPAAPGSDEERIPLRGLRKRVAEHMVEAMRHAPQVTAMDLLDVTDLVRARDLLRPAGEREGIKLTYLPFVVKATVEALRAVPTANATLDEAAGEIVVKRSYNIGIATAVPGGLVVPVVRHADARSILELAREITRVVEAARALRSSPADLQGGTFTISSFGGLPGGPLFATPIVNYPEVAILGIGRVEEQPRVVGGQVVPRAGLGVSFTFDHRVLDGEGAGQFLAILRRYLEQPLELLLTLR